MIETGHYLIKEIPFHPLKDKGFKEDDNYFYKKGLYISKQDRKILAKQINKDFFDVFVALSRTHLIQNFDSLNIKGYEIRGHHGRYKGMPKHIKHFIDEQGIEKKEDKIFDVDEYVSICLRNFWDA